METKGLLFIPDISGFTRFINETEIEHSRLIIQELLEILINANQLNLQVSEIEGDAILFYKFGESPDMSELYKQVEKMFCEFHKHLLAYDNRKYCQCKACLSSIGLTLKVITHYGEFTVYNVKNFSKLIGKDVIVAHQLLKNDIRDHEYWLITKDIVHENSPAGFAEWMKWNSGAKSTENGEIPFHYTQLTPLKAEITSDPFPQIDLSKKTKMFSVSKVYQTDIITLFHASGNFNYRSKWLEGVKMVEEVNHFLPRIGMRCRCILENGEVNIFSSSYSYNTNRIEFSETDEKKKNTTYFTLEKIDNNSTDNSDATKLTIDYYINENLFEQILFNLLHKNKIENTYGRSLLNLVALVKEIKLPPIEI